MTFRYLLLISTILLLNSPLYSQEKEHRTICYDVDNLPVFSIDTVDNEIQINYYFVTKDTVSTDIQYEGGYKSLSAYCDSLYFHREDYDFNEINAMSYYSILFEHNLKIKEVRIIKRQGYDNSKYNYDDLIAKILFSTEGKWTRRINNGHHKWYFYYGYFRLR